MSKMIKRPPLPPGQHERPLEEIHHGEKFRVRDRDWAKVWAENLSYEQAHRLKEKIAGRRLSTTVRLEPMSEPAPEWYRPDDDANEAELEQMRASAKRAAATAAHAANQRRAQRPVPVKLPQPKLAPVKKADIIDIHPPEPDDQESIDDLLGDLDGVSAEDIAHAEAQADALGDAAGGEG